MLNEYLTYIQESYDVNSLPKDLVKALLTKVYPEYYPGGKPYNIKDIEEYNNNSLNILKKYEKDSLPFQRKMKLYGIAKYSNGDMLWYSFVDKKVHLHSRELGGFEVNKSIPYKEFIKNWEALS